VNGKKAQLKTSSDDRRVFDVGILSSKFNALCGLVGCGSSGGQPGAVGFSINSRDILNI
jgi:hypothetical protein